MTTITKKLSDDLQIELEAKPQICDRCGGNRGLMQPFVWIEADGTWRPVWVHPECEPSAS